MTNRSKGQDFLNDSEVQEAINTLSNKLDDYKKHITGVKTADDDLADSYQKTLDEFGQNRGG